MTGYLVSLALLDNFGEMVNFKFKHKHKTMLDGAIHCGWPHQTLLQIDDFDINSVSITSTMEAQFVANFLVHQSNPSNLISLCLDGERWSKAIKGVKHA